MKIQVSKAFAKFINDSAREAGVKATAAVVYFSTPGVYSWTVGADPIDADYTGDYDYNTGRYKAIEISYPGEYYANCLYLTTARLTAEFRRRNVRTVEALKSMIRDLIEI